MKYRIISIGCLAAHPLWNERSPQRSGHATTTLVEAEGESGKPIRLVVDPSLPPVILQARLQERANLRPGDVTHVFLTSFHPELRRGLTLFTGARVMVSEREREAAIAALRAGKAELRDLEPDDEQDTRGDQAMLDAELAAVEMTEAAPDRIAPGVDLFPLPGVTPGLTGLLLSEPRSTILIAGDAVPTVEHLEQGKVLPTAWDIEQAQESFMEAIEIADFLILGRDNLVPNQLRRGF